MKLTQMKKGPVRSAVERELRSFANDLETRLDYTGLDSEHYPAWLVRDTVLYAVEELMRERGIVLKGGK
jgi:hypothetical protein